MFCWYNLVEGPTGIIELDLLVPIVPNHAFGTKLKFLENGSSHFNADFQLFQGPSWLPKNVEKMGGLCANFSAILKHKDILLRIPQ